MKKRRRLAGLLLLCGALLLAAPAARAQGGHSLEGRVTLPNGTQPTQPVRVTLSLGGRRIHESFTDLSGRFAFNGLGAGAYQLTAEGDGLTFETTTVRAEVSAFRSTPQSFTQNITLRPKAGAALPPAGSVSAEEFDPEVPERARALYRQGAKSAADDKPEEAARRFREAVEAHPPFYAAQLALADQYMKLQRHDEALAAYRRAGELKPDRPEPYVGAGVTLVNQKRYEEGIRLLRGLIEVDKNLAAPYLSLGYAEMMTGELRAAEEHLLRALELSRPSIAHVYLANVYEQLGRFDRAVAHLQTYLKENPDAPQAAAVRGAVEKLKQKIK
jgi:cytochrome c-type biogenesis protein CcmH/NrfG